MFFLPSGLIQSNFDGQSDIFFKKMNFESEELFTSTFSVTWQNAASCGFYLGLHCLHMCPLRGFKCANGKLSGDVNLRHSAGIESI